MVSTLTSNNLPPQRTKEYLRDQQPLINQQQLNGIEEFRYKDMIASRIIFPCMGLLAIRQLNDSFENSASLPSLLFTQASFSLMLGAAEVVCSVAFRDFNGEDHRLESLVSRLGAGRAIVLTTAMGAATFHAGRYALSYLGSFV